MPLREEDSGHRVGSVVVFPDAIRTHVGVSSGNNVSLRPKILVVEDDDDLREAVAATLSRLGVEVEQARDGLEGLERLGPGCLLPSAILLDMVMPRLDGDGFLASIRSQPHLASIPVITMSGGPPSSDPRVASRLTKPFDVEELARILVSLCEK
jgi:chemosensory pili system protein ChpA (sensor histidine kinase/response regulator)